MSLDYNAATLKTTINGTYCHHQPAHVTVIAAHGGRVDALALDTERERIVSVGRDKSVRVHGTQGGQLASLALAGIPQSLCYHGPSLAIFVGDTRGRIYVLRQEADNSIKQLSVLEGHAGMCPHLLFSISP